MGKKYNPETYWSTVGKRIESREGENVIAGDDEPYYRYKRVEFLKLLNSVNFRDKNVLEIGCGPGGNLLEVYKQNPSSLTGADISNQMVKLASEKTPKEVNIYKTNGTTLPFKEQQFDIVFTATVLQHNTNESMLHELMGEITRVSGDKIVLFERVESQVKGDDLCLGRPITYYQSFMEANGFNLVETKFINIRSSYFVSGIIRKVLNKNTRQEGEPLNKLSILLQNATLPVTKILDKTFRSKKDICKMVFQKQ